MSKIGHWLRQYPGVIIILVAVGMAVQYVYLTHQQSERVKCQANYNKAFTEQVLKRSEITTRSTANQNTLITSIGALLAQPPRTAAEAKKQGIAINKLFGTFAAEVKSIEAFRVANPLPPIPDC